MYLATLNSMPEDILLKFLHCPSISSNYAPQIPRSSFLAYDTNVLAVALSYLHVGGRTPTDL